MSKPSMTIRPWDASTKRKKDSAKAIVSCGRPPKLRNSNTQRGLATTRSPQYSNFFASSDGKVEVVKNSREFRLTRKGQIEGKRSTGFGGTYRVTDTKIFDDAFAWWLVVDKRLENAE